MFDHPLFIVMLGVFVGVFSGFMGLGGGAVMIPLMVLMLGFTQAKAQGTSLAAMIPPVALPAVIGYYGKGNVDLRVAIFLAVGILAGSWFGSYLANRLPETDLKLAFGFVLVYVAGYTIFGSFFGKNEPTRAAGFAALILAAAILIYVGVRLAFRA